MVTKTEQLPHDGGFIISEANGARSREQVTIAAGLVPLYAGTVLGLREDGKYDQFDPDSSEGADTAAVGILINAVDPSNGAGANGSDVKAAMLIRDAEVRKSDLVWRSNVTAQEQADAIVELEALGIQVRDVASRTETQST